jgi:hypothetical protein
MISFKTPIQVPHHIPYSLLILFPPFSMSRTNEAIKCGAPDLPTITEVYLEPSNFVYLQAMICQGEQVGIVNHFDTT